MTADEKELLFYRAIEDLFATLRGVPHLMSPKDFQLLRSWWQEEVPLAAVTAGVTEVFDRRRDQGDEDPITSLSYCRHAVRRHAKRMAEMSAGRTAPQDDPGAGAGSILAEIEALAARLEAAGRAQSGGRPRVEAAIAAIRRQLDAAAELAPTEAGELLFSLEATLLRMCFEALDEGERIRLEERARELAGSGSAETLERRVLALRDRELRALLELPRLELK